MFLVKWIAIGGVRPQNLLFVPQKAYFPSGGITLRQQLVYPLKALPVEKGKAAIYILVEVNDIRARGSLACWRACGFSIQFPPNVRSSLAGELQRLSLARVFYTKPRIAFLDEATSAIGFELEMQLYRKLQEVGISVLLSGQ
ncbi:hypothetical protein COOONC_26506 [Cooperia oncophora]